MAPDDSSTGTQNHAFDEVLSSGMFTFYLKDNTKLRPVNVHKGAIARLSQSLHALTTLPMKEGLAKEATLEDVDYETFIRVCEYAYRCNYKEASPIFETSEVTEVTEVPESDDWALPPRRIVNKKKDAPPGVPREKMALEFRMFPIAPAPELPSYDIRPHGGPTEDYKPVLLSHAKVYVFAMRWRIDGLKAIAMKKLHKSLQTFKLHERRIGDIIALIRFLYAIDPSSNDPQVPEPDDMQKMVASFVASNTHTLKTFPSLMNLLEEGGLFVRDVWQALP